MAGLVASDIGGADYAASKHGVIGLTKTAAADHGQQGIRINALCPAYCHSEMVDHKRLVGGARAIFDMQGIPVAPLPDWYRTIMFTTEGLEHKRLRRLVGKAFTPRAIEGLREIAAELVEERLRDRGGHLGDRGHPCFLARSGSSRASRSPVKLRSSQSTSGARLALWVRSSFLRA